MVIMLESEIPEQEVPILELVEDVSEVLNTHLRSQETRTEIAELVPFVTRVVDKLGVIKEATSPNTAQGIERLVLTFALMKRWKECKVFSAERRKLLLQLHTIYPEYLRNSPDKLSKESFYGLQQNFVKALLAEFWPESNGDLAWVRQHHGKKMDGYDDKILYVEFPLGSREGMAVANKLMTDLELNVDQKLDFGGFADASESVAFIWQDKQNTLLHEFEHLAYPGVRLDRLGGSLNEGLTEWRALHKSGGFSSLVLRSGGEGTPYANELRMVKDLFLVNSANKTIVMNHYEQRSKNSAYQWLGQIINIFSLTGVLDLYRAKPQVNECVFKLYENHWGIIDLDKIPAPPEKDEYGFAWSIKAPNHSPIFLTSEEAILALGISPEFPYSWEAAQIFREVDKAG